MRERISIQGSRCAASRGLVLNAALASVFNLDRTHRVDTEMQHPWKAN